MHVKEPIYLVFLFNETPFLLTSGAKHLNLYRSIENAWSRKLDHMHAFKTTTMT